MLITTTPMWSINKCKLPYLGETSQNLNKRLSWHNSCFRNSTAYSFCKILNTHFCKVYCKDFLPCDTLLASICNIKSSILDQNDNNIVKTLLHGLDSLAETQNARHFKCHDGILNIF